MKGMRSLSKWFGSALLCSLMLFFCSVNSWAYIECDGKINLYEWEECEQTVLFDDAGVSGNAYHSLCVKHKYIEEDRRIYLGILMENLNSELDKAPENMTNTVYISFNNSSEIVLHSDRTAEYNEDEFFLNFDCFADSFGGCAYEMECVLKELKYDEILTMNIRVEDYNGDVSQTYQINIKSEELKEEESLSVAESEKESEKESKEAAKKAEKEKTSKKSSKTSKTKTTKPKETTTEFITAVLTEEYKAYSETVEKNNNSVLIIGIACVVTSVAAMCITLFRKDKK